MQVIKPKRLGIIQRCYQVKTHHFSIGALGFFQLGQKDSPLLEEFDQWAKVTEQLGANHLFDLGFAKANDEVLMCAKPYFHTRGLLNQSRPELRLGSISKKLRLSHVKASNKASNILDELMPLAMDSPKRKKYHGSYNQYWVDHIHPGFPEDTHPLLFNHAPNSLQEKRRKLLKKSIVPGSDYQLIDVHPIEKEMTGCLPDIRVRMFVNTGEPQESEGHHFSEVECHLETVWFFPEINLGVVIYRGLTMVEDSDGLDVKNLMLCYENMADQPRSIDYYRNILALRSNHKSSLAHLFNESQLSPEKTPEEIQRIEDLIAKANSDKPLSPVEETTKAKALEIIHREAKEPQAKKLNQALDKELAKPSDDEYEIPTIPEELVASGDFDLTPVIEAATKVGEKLQQELEEKTAKLESMAKSQQEKYKDKTKKSSAHQDQQDIKAIKGKIESRVFIVAEDLEETQKKTVVGDAKAIQTIIDSLPESAKKQIDKPDAIDAHRLAENYRQMLKLQKQAQAKALEPIEEYSYSDKVKQQGRQWVLELLAGGAALAGRDFSGLDLSGIDFSHQDLRDLNLSSCDLSGCQFIHSQMDGAILVGACIHKVNFDSASLNQANLNKAKGDEASCSKSSLNDSQWINSSVTNSNFESSISDQLIATSADFSGCHFSDCRFNEANFLQANLQNTCWDRAHINTSMFLEAKLASSSWKEAKLKRCILLNITANHISFSHAELNTVQFSSEASLQQACFDYSLCDTCGFRELNMSELSARYANFIGCDFAKTKLSDAQMEHAIFSGGMMHLTQLENSDCEQALFNEVTIKKAVFTHSRLAKAHFFNCTLAENDFSYSHQKGLLVKPQGQLK